MLRRGLLPYAFCLSVAWLALSDVAVGQAPPPPAKEHIYLGDRVVASTVCSPADPANLQPTGATSAGQPTFTWAASPGAEWYLILKGSTAEFVVNPSAALWTVLGASATNSFPSPESFGDGDYVWATLSAATACEAGAAYTTFTVPGSCPLPAPGPVTAPIEAASVANASPSSPLVLSWPAVPGASVYVVFLHDATTDQGVLTQFVSQNSLTITSPMPRGLKYWAVGAWNSACGWSPIGPVATFTVSNTLFTSISSGPGNSQHTCALAVGGAAYCWGHNEHGELGNGSTTNALAPLAVTMPAGVLFKSISVGTDHTCALSTAGTAYCWGHNDSGRLGNGSTTQSLVPAAVSGGLTFASISASYAHTCGVTLDGNGYCWGLGTYGDLGNGANGNSPVPLPVSGGHKFASIEGSCGIRQDGKAYCWGGNFSGQVGDGTRGVDRFTPVAVAGGHTFTSLDAGANHNCALNAASLAYCWGHNDYDKLGITGPVWSTTPVQIGTYNGTTLALQSISASFVASCAIAYDGKAYCWGAGGQSGAEYPVSHAINLVGGGHEWRNITAGGGHTCGITRNSQTYCWGANTFGQLGDGSTNSSNLPKAVTMP